MGALDIIFDGRMNLGTKLVRLIRHAFDLIFILLAGFAAIFFYSGSPVGWIFTALAAIRYFTKND